MSGFGYEQVKALEAQAKALTSIAKALGGIAPEGLLSREEVESEITNLLNLRFPLDRDLRLRLGLARTALHAMDENERLRKELHLVCEDGICSSVCPHGVAP